MKNKKKFVKEYLSTRIDFEALKKEYTSSWLVDKPYTWLYGSGIVSKYFNYNLINEAIEKAGYRYPLSDRTWITILNIERELLDEYVL